MSRHRNRDSGGVNAAPQVEEETSASAEEVNVTEEAVVEEQQVEEAPKLIDVVDVIVTETKAPVLEQPVQKPVEVKPVQNQSQKVSPQMSKLETELNIYQDKMLGKLTAEETGKVQYGFYNMLRGALNTTNQEEARVNWNTILKFANQNKDRAFNELTIFRGAEAWPGSKTEYTNFRRLGWTIIQTADPKTRKTVSLHEINFELVTEGMRPNEKSNLINFYM